MISLKELAKMAGVDRSTVSRALNDSPRVTPKTKTLINDLAERHGYIPDDLARGLLKKRTFTIGAIIPEFLNTFYAEIIEGFEGILSQSGYSVIFGKSGFNCKNEAKCIDLFLRKRVDGIIACAVSEESVGYVKNKKINIPVVLVDSFSISDEFDSVSIDNAFGIYSAVEHFIHYGHKRLGFICDNTVTSQRLEAFKQILRKLNIPVEDDYIRTGNERYERGGYLRMKELLSFPQRPSAVLAATDTMAIGAIHAIKESGYNVPDDVSIIGFDDITVSSYLERPLTTVLQPKLEIGRIASNLLLNKINNKDVASTQQIVIKPELIIRNTVGMRKNN